MPQLVVHHLDHSRSHRLLWLLEELGLPYELVTHQRHPKSMRAPDSLRAVHPLGKAPVLVVDGEALAESGAVIEEVLERFGEGRLRPAAGTPEATAYRYWLHYAEGSLMTPLLVKLIMGQVKRAPLPWPIKLLPQQIARQVDGAYTNPELKLHTAWLERRLSEVPYFAGQAFSAADIQMSYGVEALLSRGTGSAALTAWLERVSARPAHQAATAKGGPRIPS